MLYFKQEEFACKCKQCSPKYMDGEGWVQPMLLVYLDQLRAMVGKPLYVNSGYRCPEHNLNIGGSPSSQHKLGKAADLRYPKDFSHTAFIEMCQEVFSKGGVGIYPTFVHVDVRGYKARWKGK